LSTILTSVVTSVVITLITQWITRRFNKGQDAKDKREQEVGNRLNADLNIIRNRQEIQDRIGDVTPNHWVVNPHWITFEDDKPGLRGWPNVELKQLVWHKGPTGSYSTHDPLGRDSVDRAIERKEWLLLNRGLKDSFVLN